jgi:hypothetical protein
VTFQVVKELCAPHVHFPPSTLTFSGWSHFGHLPNPIRRLWDFWSLSQSKEIRTVSRQPGHLRVVGEVRIASRGPPRLDLFEKTIPSNAHNFAIRRWLFLKTDNPIGRVAP